MDKRTFAKKLVEFMKRAKDIRVSGDPMTDPENSTLVVSTIESFDPATNDFWDDPRNKSYPRQLYCAECKKQVVMSDGLYEQYLEATPKPIVACGKCVLGI